MQKLRILYVANEISPFLKKTKVSTFVEQLSEAMQEKNMEVRVLVPRFGVINERRNRLHEVVRLSGINIPLGEDEKPLIIKVASMPSSKLQVYFIDNDDLFHRKAIFNDKESKNFFEDNDERAIFFCKGVLETVKKLGWAPNIVHCSGWMTSFVPLLMKTSYSQDAVFHNTQILFSAFNPTVEGEFSENTAEKLNVETLPDEVTKTLNEANITSLLRTGMMYSDKVLKIENDYNSSVEALLSEQTQDKLVEVANNESDIAEIYHKLYTELANID